MDQTFWIIRNQISITLTNWSRSWSLNPAILQFSCNCTLTQLFNKICYLDKDLRRPLQIISQFTSTFKNSSNHTLLGANSLGESKEVFTVTFDAPVKCFCENVRKIITLFFSEIMLFSMKYQICIRRSNSSYKKII